MAVLLTETDPALSPACMDVDLFRRRLVEILIESGVDARSAHLAPLFKLLDDDVAWFLATLAKKDADNVRPPLAAE